MDGMEGNEGERDKRKGEDKGKKLEGSEEKWRKVM